MPSYPTSGLIARLDFNNPSCFSNGGLAVTNLAVGGSNWNITNTSYTYNSDFGSLSFVAGNPLASNTLNPFGDGNVSFSLAFWHYFSSSSSPARKYVWYNGMYFPSPLHITSYSTGSQYELIYGPGLTLLFSVNARLNRYNHICITYNNATQDTTFYVNGEVAGVLNYPQSQGISPSGYPGVQFNDPWNNTGIDPIADIYLYNRCITAQEVRDILDQDTNTFNKVVDLDFSNSSTFSGSGLTVYDLSNYNNDFYLANTNYIFSEGDGGELYVDTINQGTTFKRGLVSGFGYSTDPFTAHIWVKLEAYNAINLTQIWCANFTGGAGNNNNVFLGLIGSNNNLFFTDGTAFCTTSLTLDLYRWNLITLVKPNNGGTDDCKLFVNGTSVGFGGSSNTPINLYGGAQYSGQLPNIMALSGGYIEPTWNSEQTTGQFAFYNIEQSNADVVNFYNSTKARFDNLVALYDFSDPTCYPGSGNTVYDIEKNNNLTINNSPFVADGNSSYFSFNGSNQYIYNSNFPGLGNTFTMNVWARPEPGSLDDVIINGGKDSSGQMPAISIGWYAGPNYGVPFAHFNYGIGYRPGTAYIPNEWQMYTFTADGTTVTLYQNGVATGSTSQNGGTWGSRPDFLSGFALGTALNNSGSPSGSEIFLGDIAYASVYNTALGSTAVNNLYTSLADRFSATQILKYDFSDPACYPGTGNTVYDLSFQGLNGTITSLGVGVTYVPNGQQSYFQWNTSAYGYIDSEVYDNTDPQLFSLVVWTKISTATQGCIISTAQTNSPGGVPFIYANDYYTPGFIRASNAYNYGNITSPVELNKWKFYVYTYDGSTMKLYVDGNLVGTDPIGPIAAISGSSPYVRVGNYAAAVDGSFDNKIAYAEFYRGKALTAGEVASIYNNTNSRFIDVIPITGSNVGGRSFGKGLNG